jgi:hypothetical protein
VFEAALDGDEVGVTDEILLGGRKAEGGDSGNLQRRPPLRTLRAIAHENQADTFVPEIARRGKQSVPRALEAEVAGVQQKKRSRRESIE